MLAVGVPRRRRIPRITRILGGVGRWGCCSGSAAGEVPFQVAGLGLAEVPAGCLLGRVVSLAKRREVAFARASALVKRDRMVIIAAPGGPPAAREAAGPVPGFTSRRRMGDGW